MLAEWHVLLVSLSPPFLLMQHRQLSYDIVTSSPDLEARIAAMRKKIGGRLLDEVFPFLCMSCFWWKLFFGGGSDNFEE